MTALGVIFSYTGCVLLFQSGEHRRRHKAVRIPMEKAALTRKAGWVLLLAALAALSIPRGFEIGLVLWLAALALGGIVSLLVSALAPKAHLLSPAAVAGLSFTLGLPFLLFGGAG